MSEWESDYSHCDVCTGAVKLLCPRCYRQIQTHSHEGDFICEVHNFVDPVTEDDLRALKAALAALDDGTS